MLRRLAGLLPRVVIGLALLRRCLPRRLGDLPLGGGRPLRHLRSPRQFSGLRRKFGPPRVGDGIGDLSGGRLHRLGRCLERSLRRLGRLGLRHVRRSLGRHLEPLLDGNRQIPSGGLLAVRGFRIRLQSTPRFVEQFRNRRGELPLRLDRRLWLSHRGTADLLLPPGKLVHRLEHLHQLGCPPREFLGAHCSRLSGFEPRGKLLETVDDHVLIGERPLLIAFQESGRRLDRRLLRPRDEPCHRGLGAGLFGEFGE